MRSGAKRMSRVLHWIFLLGIPMSAAIVLFMFLNLEWVLSFPQMRIMSGLDTGALLLGPVTWPMKLLGLLAASVPLALTCAMFWSLAGMFKDFAGEKVFTNENVHRIRRVGVLLLARECLAPVQCAAMSLVLSMNNPPGQHILSISLESSNVTAIVTALTIIVAAHVMDQARELKEEAEFTI